ncbi:hypothetical protein FRX31_010137, partial [Thalictrum thalictroides]
MMRKRQKSVQKREKGKVKVKAKASELRKSPRKKNKKIKKVTFAEPVVEPKTQGGGVGGRAVRWSIRRLEKSRAQQNEEDILAEDGALEGCDNNADNEVTFLGENNTEDILAEDDLVLPTPTNNSEPAKKRKKSMKKNKATTTTTVVPIEEVCQILLPAEPILKKDKRKRLQKKITRRNSTGDDEYDEYVPEMNVEEEVEAETMQCEKRNKGKKKPWQKDDTPPPVDINRLPEEELDLDTAYYDDGEDMVDEINAEEDYRELESSDEE